MSSTSPGMLVLHGQICILLLLGSCGILNLVAVSVFSRPKTEVLGLVLALKCEKIRKSARSAFYLPGPHVATHILRFRVIKHGGFCSMKNVRRVV